MLAFLWIMRYGSLVRNSQQERFSLKRVICLSIKKFFIQIRFNVTQLLNNKEIEISVHGPHKLYVVRNEGRSTQSTIANFGTFKIRKLSMDLRSE